MRVSPGAWRRPGLGTNDGGILVGIRHQPTKLWVGCVCLHSRGGKLGQLSEARVDIPPRRCLPPVEFCRGTKPSQAANSRPLRKPLGSTTVAAMALAMIGPIGLEVRRLAANDNARNSQ